MAFERPLLSQLIRRAKNDIMTRLQGADANLRGSPEEVMAISTAGLTHGVHGHIKWLSKQILTDSEDPDNVVREAGIYGLQQKPAVAASGNIIVNGTSGTLVPAGSIWTRTDGTTYSNAASATLASGQALITVVATSPGAGTDCDPGSSLALSSAIAGVNSAAIVDPNGIEGGSDIEDADTDLRNRLLLEKGTRPSGGGPGDYERWLLEVSGVTRAWEYPKLFGPGTVGVYFVRDNDSTSGGADVSIIPSVGEVATAQTYLTSVAPGVSDNYALAPTGDVLNFNIAVLPNSTTVQAAVAAELRALMKGTCQPGGTLPLLQIENSIQIAAGVASFTLNSPTADVVAAAGHMTVFGSITWA